MQPTPLRTNMNQNSTSSNMIIALAWLSLAVCGCLLAQTGQTLAAPSQQEPASRGSPETVALFELAAARPVGAQQQQQQQQQMVRRRRSSPDLWPRHAASLRQQRLASDAAFSQQLAELIAQARHDKSLERALLKMLINATLRPTSVPASAESQSAAESALGSGASIDQLLASAERAQREEQQGDGAAYPAARLISNLEQILSSAPGFVDQSVGNNDLGQLVAGDGYALDKREFKPCSFNAISCAKNPFRTSS